MTGLAELNSKILLDDDVQIEAAEIAKLDMSFLDLDLLNDQALGDMLGAAMGASAVTFWGEMRQLVSLIRSKLQQMRAYHEAALSKQEHEQRREFLSRSRRAARSIEFVDADTSEAAERISLRDTFMPSCVCIVSCL